jgi:transglutaminase/protease-like cytokinesis protein 3
MLKSNSKYYYSLLDSSAKRIYNSILLALVARNPNPSFMINPLGRKPDISKIVQYIDYDNPDLFYVDFRKIQYLSTLTKISLQLNFLYSNRQIDAMEKQLESIIIKILSTHGFASMDAYNKELILHDNLVKNVSYSNAGVNAETTSIVGTFILRSAVCEGYARAFKLLCDRAELFSLVISGKATLTTGQEELHAWNIVNLDGICSHVDVTWDSTTRGSSNICYDYFNLTDNDIARDHTWNGSLFPACTSDKNNYHVKNELCINNHSDFKNYVAERVKRGQKKIFFKLTCPEKTMEQVMNTSQEALQSALNGYSMNLQYNSKLGTGLLNLN